MSTTEKTDAGFTALPAGWYNYYSEIDDRGDRRVYRTPCPGILKSEILHVNEDGTKTHSHYVFVSADLTDGMISGAGEYVTGEGRYLGTFYGEEYWQEVGKAPNEELQTV